MKLTELFVRFFKSFNYDFERKLRGGTRSKWEESDSTWYPYVRVKIEPSITAIVGSNEAGKSQLLKAIKKAYGVLPIEREDFCRYSSLYSIESDREKWSEFGLGWNDFSPEEKDEIVKLIDPKCEFEIIRIFRTDNDRLRIYFDELHVDAVSADVKKVLDVMPGVFELKRDLKMPDSIPLSLLYEEDDNANASDKKALSEGFLALVHQTAIAHSDEIGKRDLNGFDAELKQAINEADKSNSLYAQLDPEQIKLVKHLLCTVAKISPKALIDLDEKIAQGNKTGYVESTISEISSKLNNALNIQSFWRQDTKFQIRVTRGGAFLQFVVRDRTNSDYSFDERSDGLKYFLSYYIQYLAYTQESGRNEVLLMDEPDAYLSALAQQDLLKVFERFAAPDRLLKPVQVIYVTHSPFLIDRNRPERVKVIDKGQDDEGTRIVEGGSNHYEPLRSAFGLAIGETVFIGNSNLIVEGISDQILVVGMSNVLAKDTNRLSAEFLNLNRVTVNDGGGAQNVPHIVFLARGRDEKKPVVVVLLDNDQEGRDVHNKLSSKDAIIRIYDSKFNVFVTEREEESTIEDLIPKKLLVESARRLQRLIEGSTKEFDEVWASVESSKSQSFASLQEAFAPFEIAKPALAKELLKMLSEETALISYADDIEVLKGSFASLFTRLNDRIEDAEYQNSKARIRDRLYGLRANFERDHPHNATKEDALKLLRNFRRVLDDSPEAIAINSYYDLIEHDFALSTLVHMRIENYPEFQRRVTYIEHIVDKPKESPQEPVAQGVGKTSDVNIVT